MRGSRGHTLLELIIALAVLSTVFIIAAELLLARERQLARAGKSARRINAEGAFDQLYRDLRNARAVPGASVADAVFTTTPLVLEQANGAIVSWRRDGATLLRGRVDAGVDQGERPALDRVDRFAWRTAGGSLRPLIEIEVGFEAAEQVIGGGPVGEVPVDQDRRRFVVALRGAGGEAW